MSTPPHDLGEHDTPDCPEKAVVSGVTDALICNLPAGHIGPRHFDQFDGLWWSRDEVPDDGCV